MTTPASLTRYRLAVLGAAVLFSTGGAGIKACSLGGWQVSCLRSGIAALTLALLVPSSRRGWTWQTQLVGLAYAATMILFVLANKSTTAASSIFLQSTAPLYVLVLAPFVLREPFYRRDLPFALAIMGGLSLFFIGTEAAVTTAPSPTVGNVLAAAAGLTWSLTLMGLRWLERRAGDGAPGAGSGMAAVVAGNGIAFGVSLPWAFTQGTAIPGLADSLVVVYLGMIQVGLAYVLLVHGFRRLRAIEASLLILLEPTLNPVWAWLLHKEIPSSWALAGGCVILLATASFPREKKPRAEP